MSEFNEMRSTSTLPYYRLAVAHEEMNSKRRNTMEDCHRILPRLHSELQQYSYFGIYDGHGGRQIADFLENALEQTIANELRVSDDASVLERLTRAYLITDMKSKQLNITTSGATAVSVLLRVISSPDLDKPPQRTLFVGNVGDSRAVLVSTQYPGRETTVANDNEFRDSESAVSSGYIATRLSYDHRAEDASEQQRIKEAGGFVTRNRVLGILAVSRSFGDHGMKDFVTAMPYVSETDLSLCGDCPMLIMACDGVWDVLSDQEAADLLLDHYHNRYRQHRDEEEEEEEDTIDNTLKKRDSVIMTEVDANGHKQGEVFEDAAHILVQAAIDRGSADNVTAIVVFL